MFNKDANRSLNDVKKAYIFYCELEGWECSSRGLLEFIGEIFARERSVRWGYGRRNASYPEFARKKL